MSDGGRRPGRTGGGAPVTQVDGSRLVHVTTWLAIVIVVLLVLEQFSPVRSFVWSVDRWWHRTATTLEGPAGVTASQVLSVLGGVYVTAPLRVAVGVWFAVARRWWALAAWVISIGLSEVVVTGMKLAIDRPRPPGSLEAARQAAFPSGHAGATAVTVVTLLLLFAPALAARPRWWIAGGGLIAVMAASRIYLRVHWPSDVLMGTLVGVASATFAVGVVAMWADRRERPRGVRLRGRRARRTRS